MRALVPNNSARRLTLAALAMLAMATTSPHVWADSATVGAVTINTTFPGGNLAVMRNDGESVHVAPDLRGDNPWFYWCFEATLVTPGRVNFVFPEKVGGFKNGAIGFQGPAISTDRDKTWQWMGTENVQDNAFFFDFARKEERVRFAVTIPYLQTELDAFRKRYVLYAVPFVDKDGVEEGDQGKNRKPHDHNRDYGEKSIYPEVQAIKKLDSVKNFKFALDFHCPTLAICVSRSPRPVESGCQNRQAMRIFHQPIVTVNRLATAWIGRNRITRSSLRGLYEPGFAELAEVCC